MRQLAQRGEVKVEAYGFALRRDYINPRFARLERRGEEIEVERGPGERASALVRATQIRFTVRAERTQRLRRFRTRIEDADFEVLPEVIRTLDVAGRRARPGARRRR